MAGRLLLVTASGLARETAELAVRSGWEVVGFLDDNPDLLGSTPAVGARVVGGIDVAADYPEASLAICAGKGSSRAAIAARLSALGIGESRYATLIDPSVVVPGSCVVGAGSILLAGTVLTTSVRLGRHVVCMPHVVLTHDNRVADYATLCAGVLLGGSVAVGSRAYLGMGASVREGTTVGEDSILGMGAVLLNDLPAGQVWAGVPASPVVHSTPRDESSGQSIRKGTPS